MKKLRYTFFTLFTVLLLFCAFQVSASAYNVGYSQYSNVVTYINHYPIPSWNYNGQTLICVEDLQKYGFDVKWNEYKQTINITRNDSTNISPVLTFRPPQSLIGTNQIMLKSTDVSVWYWNYRITAYGGLDGYTLINVADLACMNNVSVEWVPSVNAVKVWVTDGLEMCSAPWKVNEFDGSMTVYTTCNPPNGYRWHAQYYGGVLTLAIIDDEEGLYCVCPYGKLDITDVIDANGNSRKKPDSDGIKEVEADFSNLPYFYNFTDMPVSASIILNSDDLIPATASEKGGIIKFHYGCFIDSTNIYGEIRVDCLPD